MMSRKLHLRANVALRPLLNHWPLWTMLIPAHQAALVTSRIQVPIMESYLRAPQQHMIASRTPALMGGPWINFAEDRAGEIKALLADTRLRQAQLLDLTAALEALDALLQRHAPGESLEPLYRQLPQPLRGYVELVYDLDSRADVRFLEGLLYRSPHMQRRLQQFSLERVETDWRPYERSTPVLDDGRCSLVDLPWSDQRLELLLAAEQTPTDAQQIAQALGIDLRANTAWAALWSDEPAPRRHAPPPPGSIRVRYFGHATVLIESNGAAILTDPFLSYDYASELSRYTFSDLPDRIDFIVITHAHSDHFRPEDLLRLRGRTQCVVVPRAGGRRLQDPSLKMMLHELGFAHVVELSELESLPLAHGGTLTALPFLGEHSDLDVQGKSGYHIRLHGRSIACMADAAALDPDMYAHVARDLGPLDLLFVGMECEGSPMSWGYGHLFMRKPDRRIDQSRRDRGSNAAEARELVTAWPARRVCIYALGQEPWLNHVLAIDQNGSHKGIAESDALIAWCEAQGIAAERLFAKREILLVTA